MHAHLAAATLSFTVALSAQPPAGIRPTPKAVTAAVEWLKHQQQSDGGFVVAAGKPDFEGAALFALVCLGDGSTPQQGKHREPLERCIDWLFSRIREDGGFEDTGPGAAQRHAQLTYALVEAAGLSQADKYKAPAIAALRRLLAYREKDGGWSTAAGTPSDPIVTAWAITALASAKALGIPVDTEPETLTRWFDDRAIKEPGPAGAELFCRFFTQQRDKLAKPTAREQQLADAADAVTRDADPGTIYWTCLATFQFGGRTWQAGAEHLKRLAGSQVQEGAHAGSWEPAAGTSRLATTALNALTIETPYRYARNVR